MDELQYLQHAWVSGSCSGWVSLTQEWEYEELPPLLLRGGELPGLSWYAMARLDTARLCGFFWYGEWVTFVVPRSSFGDGDLRTHGVYVVGSFNGWQEAIGQECWQMRPRQWNGEEVWVLTVENPLNGENTGCFKFVTGTGEWIAPPWESPVRVEDEEKNVNYELRNDRRSRFLFGFKSSEPLPLGNELKVVWNGMHHREEHPLQLGSFFLQMGNDLPLGALYSKNRTTFRVFAPRAHQVLLVLGHSLDRSDWREYGMEREEQGTWVASVEGDWKEAYYGYRIHGNPNSRWSHFDPQHLVLDPYALAVVGAEGPGIVLPQPRKVAVQDRFTPPSWHDLVILEVHLADLLAKDPGTHHTAPTYVALAHRMEDCGSYLGCSPVNAVEFQPLHQNDSVPVSEYHWGYMPVNYFSPHSGYSTDPARGGSIREFRSLVKAIHDSGKAVIMDVVYNHYGEPNHLLYLDKLYYFRTTQEGELYNYSGCGNDLRTEARMTRRLILDSLRYWVEVFDVDGFRFDLAELMGKPILEEIERELKRIKPSIILIAEPWSFRGHIAGELRNTGLASWNDGYREHVFEYLIGRGSQETIVHFITGSPGDFACWPAQTVNYLESHDDSTLLDKLTENTDRNGEDPTIVDRRRMHLGIAIMMISIGIPMFAQGVEMLRSKQGKANTYQDEGANSLDFTRWSHFSGTSQYFRDWCKWRLSAAGRLLRAKDPIPESFWQFFGEENGSAVAILYNRERNKGQKRLLFAVNPNRHAVEIPVEGWDWAHCRQIADTERVQHDGLRGGLVQIGLCGPVLSGLSCALWEG